MVHREYFGYDPVETVGLYPVYCYEPCVRGQKAWFAISITWVRCDAEIEPQVVQIQAHRCPAGHLEGQSKERARSVRVNQGQHSALQSRGLHQQGFGSKQRPSADEGYPQSDLRGAGRVEHIANAGQNEAQMADGDRPGQPPDAMGQVAWVTSSWPDDFMGDSIDG